MLQDENSLAFLVGNFIGRSVLLVRSFLRFQKILEAMSHDA